MNVPSWEARLSDILRERNSSPGSPSGAGQLMSPGSNARRSSPVTAQPAGNFYGGYDDRGGHQKNTTPRRSVSPAASGVPAGAVDYLRASTARNLRLLEAESATSTRSGTPKITPLGGLYVVGEAQQQFGRPPTPPRSIFDNSSPTQQQSESGVVASLTRRNAELADELRLVKSQLEHKQVETVVLQREVVAVRAEITMQATIAVEKMREAEQQWHRERESLQSQLRYQTEQVQILSNTIHQLLQAKQQDPQRSYPRSPSGQQLGY